ncbi:tape measure protein [Weissella paramesenteroides]|uniref:tape measure protein n=1 Tax=Weissella paramesenteroides TaxID=1249 RepID=UPI00223B1E7A|nr:tape measure protein [Weissella paramesenteroides]MCT0485685.1 CHAP domain-containing protein [Weissella paramesenteroides]
MAKEKVANLMSTGIGLDTTGAVQSINQLKQSVAGATNEWKQMESSLKRSGDELGAYEARYKGLSDAVGKQSTVLDELKRQQGEVNRSTEAGEQTYQKYENQIVQAERKLTSLTAQQAKAEQVYHLQESGIASLNKEIRQNIQETDAQVERLRAEGKETEANEAKKKGLSATLEKQTKLYEAQSQELKRLTDSGEASADSISKQKIALEKTGKYLAENKSAMSTLNSEMDKTSPNPFVRLKASIKSTNEQAEKTHSIFKSVFSASLLANAVSGAWNIMTMHIGDAVRMGNTYLEQQDKMNAQWKTLAGSNSGAKAMIKGINDLATSAQNSSEMVNGLASQFYAIDKNKDHVLALSKATLTLQDAFGASDDAVQNFGQQWSQMMANGKVSAQDFMSFTNVFPALKPALLDYEKDVTHNSNLTMKQLNDMISQGKISSETMNTVLENTAKKNKEATKNFGETLPGMTRTITATMPRLIGELEKPFYKMKNPLVGSISKWITDKDTAKEFNALGKATTQALSNITEAFGGTKLNGGKVLDGVIKGLTKSVQEFGKWTATHKKDIREFFGSFKEKTADTIKVLGASLQAFSKVTTPIIKLMAEHPKVAGTFLAGFMIASKLGGAITAITGISKAMKILFSVIGNFAKTNPVGLIITGIVAVTVALTSLYKHNKKFRDFVNGLVKSAQNFFKGIAKWFGEAYKKVLSIFKAILKFMKKDWKEILLLIVNPISGAFALTYKHNAKFRKAINDLVKDVLKFFTNMGKGIANIFTSMWRNITKVYNSILKFIRDTTNDIGKIWSKGWQSISNFFGGIWNGMKKFGHDSIWSIKNTFDDVLGRIGKTFSNTWKGIKSGFSDMWNGMKQLAGDGINAVIKIPNTGIDGINGLIHDFGGPKHAIGKIPKVKFAQGTGAIKNLTHAVLNDGNDSPATGNKEMLIHPNGAPELVQGRNTERLLLPGTEVLNASETAMLMRMEGITHFASGTGFWSRLWGGVTDVAGNAWSGLKNGVAKFTKMFEFITDAVAHPVKTLESKLSLKTAGLDSVYKDFGGAFFGKVKGQAKDWWSTLWNMASDASSAGADGGMKGDDYKYKNRVADSNPPDEWGYFIKECVSFVASRLANSGVSTAKFSHLGNGMDWVNAKVPHMSKPKVGSVAVYGPGSEFGNHVAMVTGVQGGKISGEEYNWNGDHKYHTYHGRNASGATTFLDFGLSGGSSKSDVKADSPLAKLIKKQTGGMLGWIQKFIAPLNDSSSGVDGDVHSWADDVKKALRKLNLSTSNDMVQRVLRQIASESGGNPKAVQGYIPGDPNNAPQNRARGLMQVVPSTFNANALPGHHDIFNGYDNILAGLNYARKRYGDSLSYLGNGHGYENGGFISSHGFYEIAERNMPEVVIPLDPAKKPRASELLAETTARIHGNEIPTASQTDLSRVESKLDNMISLLSQLVTGQGNQVVQAIVDRNDLYRKQANDVNLRGYQSLI